MDDSGIKQHKRLAMSGGDPQMDGNFGCDSLASTSRPGGASGSATGMVKSLASTTTGGGAGSMSGVVQSLASTADSTGNAGLGAKVMAPGARNAQVGGRQRNPDHGPNG